MKLKYLFFSLVAFAIVTPVLAAINLPSRILGKVVTGNNVSGANCYGGEHCLKN